MEYLLASQELYCSMQLETSLMPQIITSEVNTSMACLILGEFRVTVYSDTR